MRRVASAAAALIVLIFASIALVATTTTDNEPGEAPGLIPSASASDPFGVGGEHQQQHHLPQPQATVEAGSGNKLSSPPLPPALF